MLDCGLATLSTNFGFGHAWWACSSLQQYAQIQWDASNWCFQISYPIFFLWTFFVFLTLVSLISKAFQTLLSKHLFPTENLFSISGLPEHIIGIPSPVHWITAFPCLPSVPYTLLRASPYCTHSWRPSRRPLCKLINKSFCPLSK